MKKIILSIFLCSILLLGTTACGNDNKDLTRNDAIVTNNDAVTENLTMQELISVYNENSVKFNSKYYLADIEIYGTVDKVSARTYYNNSSESTDVIYFKEGWVVLLEEGKYDFVADLNKGDVIYVHGLINSGFAERISIDDVIMIFNITGMKADEVNNKIQIQNEKNKLYDFLEEINDEMDFLYKYSGNDAWGQGSIDAFKERIVDSWNNQTIDLELISQEIDTIEDDVNSIKDNCNSMMDLIKKITDNFNQTNVKNIKDLAKTTSKIIELLLEQIKYN